MKRMILIALGLAVLAACSRSGARKQDFFPLKPGSEWQYGLVEYTEYAGHNDTARVGTYTVRIADSTKAADSTRIVRSEWQGSETGRTDAGVETTYVRSGSICYRSDAHAVYRYLVPASPRESILVLPPKAGQKWHSGILDYEVVGQENITVQGVRYPGCWRVNYGPKGTLFVSAWYAPGIGLVRQLDEREVQSGVTRSDYYLVRTNLK